MKATNNKNNLNKDTTQPNNSLWQSLDDDQQEVVKGGNTLSVNVIGWPFRGFPY